MGCLQDSETLILYFNISLDLCVLLFWCGFFVWFIGRFFMLRGKCGLSLAIDNNTVMNFFRWTDNFLFFQLQHLQYMVLE